MRGPGVAIAARVAAIAISMRIIGGDKYDLRFYLNSHGFEGTVTANVVAESGKVLASCQFKVEKERGCGTWGLRELFLVTFLRVKQGDG